MNDKHGPLMKYGVAASSLASLLLLSGVPALAADAQRIVPEPQIERVAIEQVQMDDGTVRGVVTNRGDARVEDLKLRVTYQWRWRDEFNPGVDGPGFSDTLQLDDALAPGEQREFTYTPSSGLPSRDDGQFAPAVSIVSFTAYDGADDGQGAQ